MCVAVCSCVFFSFPPCSSISQFHLCYFHPLSFQPPPPSIPLFHWVSHRSSRRPNQFSSESSPVSIGPGLQHWNYLSSYFISHHTHCTQRLHVHTPPAFTLWICTARAKHLNIFFSLYSLTPTPLAHLFLKWLLMCFFCREEAYLEESWSSVSINENCFGEVSPFLAALCRSLQAVGIYTNSVNVQGSGWGGGGRKEVWGRRDERCWRRREKHCYLASRSRGQHRCAAAAKSYRGSSRELFHSQSLSSLHTIPHSTLSFLSFFTMTASIL